MDMADELDFISRKQSLHIKPWLFFILLAGFPLTSAATDEAAVHNKLFAENNYPSAAQCSACHKQIYDEWRSSSHAYSAISPMFHKFENAINALAPTISNFCVRCHISVGTALGEERDIDFNKRAAVAKEGVTCISCHRVKTEYGRMNGERRIEPGPIFDPMYGSANENNIKQVIDNAGDYKIKTNNEDNGQAIHTNVIKFEQIHQAEFCMSCHQVAVNLGIKLEVVWEQYRASPAHDQGITCQACHMGKVPGIPSGFEQATPAVINDKPIGKKRDHYNHAFYGPGTSIAHPGIFPHNLDADEWTMDQWLQFDYRTGWGLVDFENNVADSYQFPEIWEDSSDRETAREIIADNLKKLKQRNEERKTVMEMGSHINGPFFINQPKTSKNLTFSYEVINTNSGHNVPSGSLGAQPEMWLNVALVDPSGNTIWESGYIDSQGDMADLHSQDVRDGKLVHDDQLFNLQTKFLTTNVKGTDREMYLPVNFDIDQIPLLRPARQPVSVMNHPPFVRMEGHSIPPLGSRNANYEVPANLLKQRGKYRLAIRMRSRAEPIYFMRFVGATDEMIQRMNESIIDFHSYSVEFEIK